MPGISENMMGLWRNYHLTEQGRYVPVLPTDPDYARVLGQGKYPDGTVREFQSYIGRVLTPPRLLVPKRKAVDLVPIGRGWRCQAAGSGARSGKCRQSMSAPSRRRWSAKS